MAVAVSIARPTDSPALPDGVSPGRAAGAG
jgi:hypothetical protein